jgi:hypothetical protein
MSRRLFPWLAIVLILILPVTTAYLQGGTCPPLVERALNEAGRECASLPRNAACYGFNQVSARFSNDVPESFFTQPADTTDLTTLQSIATAALDDALGLWGVAVLNVQANVPNSLPGQGVRFILFGEAALTNEVNPADALLPTNPIEATVNTQANFRSGPSTRANVLAGILAGTVVSVEGISPDGAWLRVNAPQVGMGWMSRELISTTGDFGSLPVVTEESRSPMQAFQFRTGLGRVSCDQAPSALMVQGPQGLKVTIQANGAEISLGSTILLRATDDRMQVSTIEGEAIVDGLLVPEGFEIGAPLDENGEAGDFAGMERIAEDELQDWQWLETVPEDLLEYELEVPTFDEFTEILLDEPLTDDNLDDDDSDLRGADLDSPGDEAPPDGSDAGSDGGDDGGGGDDGS